MLTCLLVSPDVSKKEAAAEEILSENNLSRNSPNLLWFEKEEKLGVEQARYIREFLSLKPYQGILQAVVIVAAENLTTEAQNALLKTLEEPPGKTIIILGVTSEEQLLPTVVSRCRVINLATTPPQANNSFQKEIEQLVASDMEKRFQFVEKLENKEEFLHTLTVYFREKMLGDSQDPKLQTFLKDLIEAERWAHQNVNIRAILEYLMLRMPD